MAAAPRACRCNAYEARRWTAAFLRSFVRVRVPTAETAFLSLSAKTEAVMKRVLATAQWTLDLDDAARVVTLARTSTTFGEASLVDELMKPVNAALDVLRRSGCSALIDLRNAPLRSDEAFEKAFAPHRLALALGWKRVALLVATAIGKLQVSRYHHNDKTEIVIFTDADLARKHVTL
jgi:hypothetical protein